MDRKTRRELQIIAHRDLSYIGENVFSMPYGTGLMQRIAGAKDGWFEMVLDGTKSTLFTHDLMNQWYVILAIENGELFTDVRSMIAVNIATFLIVFVLIALFYIISYRNEERGRNEAEALKMQMQKQSYESELWKLGKSTANAAPGDGGKELAVEMTALEALYASVPDLHYREAKTYLQSEELLEKTLRKFYELITEKADEVERLSKEGDYENYTIQVHSLKSSAKLIGASKLSDLARQLEEAGNTILVRQNG